MARNKIPRPLPNPALDLFGDVPVTWQDVEAWMQVICSIDCWTLSRARVQEHIRSYCVIDKIKAYKREGLFYEQVLSRFNPPAPPANWWDGERDWFLFKFAR